MEKISKYVDYFEVTHSNQAKALRISNIPNAEQLGNLKLVCTNIFDKVREHFGVPIGISSAFRSYELNQRIGGSKSSQHCLGQAADISCGERTAEMYEYIKNNLIFDQLIWEFGDDHNPSWVHVSYSSTNNRKECLRAYKINGKTVYQHI